MNLDYLLAGLLQGLLEWLPVSSSGQVMIALSVALGVSPESAYRIALALHLGTLISAVIYYRKDVVDGLVSIGHLRLNTVSKIWIIATPISLLIGYPLFKLYENVAGNVPQDWVMLLVGVPLMAVGVLGLGIKGNSGKNEPTTMDLILLGLVQGFSVIPGISRSGVTIALLLVRGLNPLSAVRTSFIAGIPVIGAAALYTMLFEGAFSRGTDAVLGGLAALAGGLVGIGIIEWLARRINQYLFAIIIGVILVIVGIYSII